MRLIKYLVANSLDHFISRKNGSDIRILLQYSNGRLQAFYRVK